MLYTDRCEVIEFPSQRFVYPIFKNGSTSLYREQKERNLKIYISNQIGRLNNIEIILREPVERFSAGYASFVRQTLEIEPTLDRKTIEYFANNYLFLNKHFTPQLLWLVNLIRFTDPECVFHFYDMARLKTFTTYNENFLGLYQKLDQVKNLESYIKLDNILYSCINKSVTWVELTSLLKEKESLLYKHVFREKDFHALF